MKTILALLFNFVLVALAFALVGRAAAAALPYQVRGSIDVGTLENSVFSLGGTMYLLENINSGYIDNAGRWFDEFRGHSYARVRRLDDGVVVVNISSTIGYGFMSAYVDRSRNRLWIFGTNHDRGGPGPPGGYRCPGLAVTSWWVEEADLADDSKWQTACTDAVSRDNVEVARVRTPAPTLPNHTHVMSNECPGFSLIDAPDGNLTKGWKLAPGDAGKSGPCGGPSVRWTMDVHGAVDGQGYYYRITGGHHVELARSRDLRDPWQSVTMIQPTPDDAEIAPYAGFLERAGRLGFATNAAHWQAWDWNSNDADVCCAEVDDGEGSFVIFGASTQGKPPHAPVPQNQSCTNVIGTSKLPLPEFLDAFFDKPLPRV